MDDERFDDEIRQKSPERRIVLKDGREFTYKYIISRLSRAGVKNSEMEEVLCKLLKNKTLLANILINDRVTTIDSQKLIKIINAKNREKSQEIKFEIDDISGDSPLFFNLLERCGLCISLK